MKRYIVSACAAALSATAFSAAAQDIQLLPGQLAEKIDGLSINGQSRLTLRGGADIRDLMTLRDVAFDARVLDLSEVEISGYHFQKPAFLGKSIFDAKTLPSYIFFRSSWEEVILPADLKAIDAGTFSGSAIRRIVIPEGVEVIGDYAFYGCDNLESISIPEGVKLIGKGAFANCRNLKEADLRASKVTEIPEKCFADSPNLVYLYLPTDILIVGSEAFSGTAVTEIILPKVTYMAPYSLAGMTALESVTLNKEARYSEGTLMNNGRLERISGAPSELPALFAANCYSYAPSDLIATTEVVGRHAFSNSGVSELILSGYIIAVDHGAFSGLYALESIDATAMKGNIPAAEDDSFDGIEPADVLLMVDNDAIEAWRSHPVWGLFNVQSDVTTGKEVPAIDKAGISIALSDRTLIVTVPGEISSGGVFSIDGVNLANLPAGASRAEISLENVAEKVVIVSVSTADDHKTAKLILK